MVWSAFSLAIASHTEERFVLTFCTNACLRERACDWTSGLCGWRWRAHTDEWFIMHHAKSNIFLFSILFRFFFCCLDCDVWASLMYAHRIAFNSISQKQRHTQWYLLLVSSMRLVANGEIMRQKLITEQNQMETDLSKGGSTTVPTKHRPLIIITEIIILKYGTAFRRSLLYFADQTKP